MELRKKDEIMEQAEFDQIFIEIAVGAEVDAIFEQHNESTDAITGAINAGEAIEEQQATELGQKMHENMVEVDPDQPSCCIDGRTCLHHLNEAESSESVPARAGVAGGALVTAYAAAEAIGWFGDDSGDIEERLERLSTVLEANGIVLGGHTDANSVALNFLNADGKPATGCGANDRYPQIAMKPYEASGAVKLLTGAVMGDAYDPNMPRIAKTEMEQRLVGWNPKKTMDKFGGGSAVEVLASPHELPNHGHKEFAVLFNYCENTTLDRDAFTKATDGKQVFKVDMWYIDKLAHALATGTDADKQYNHLRQAMVEYQVGTYLTLADGSQRVYLAKKNLTKAA